MFLVHSKSSRICHLHLEALDIQRNKVWGIKSFQKPTQKLLQLDTQFDYV